MLLGKTGSLMMKLITISILSSEMEAFRLLVPTPRTHLVCVK